MNVNVHRPTTRPGVTIHLSHEEAVRLYALSYYFEGGAFVVPDEYKSAGISSGEANNLRICNLLGALQPAIREEFERVNKAGGDESFIAHFLQTVRR